MVAAARGKRVNQVVNNDDLSKHTFEIVRFQSVGLVPSSSNTSIQFS
jgi:hypothetical protein